MFSPSFLEASIFQFRSVSVSISIILHAGLFFRSYSGNLPAMFNSLTRQTNSNARPKVPMSRPSQTESAYVQTFVRSSCVEKSSCPNFRAFKIAYVQTIVR